MIKKSHSKCPVAAGVITIVLHINLAGDTVPRCFSGQKQVEKK